ncbi:helix-turn-helix domain-containing protein [Bradyrhizobium sp.]|uniref:helix-turn-helix domain-containing protein n=1 Tax=Bradyrhizobium sp. TaxID=376 RepID=UPI0025C3474C|nr:helix-turn-helix domain-containing protein [Bradyrhizobium sp.]
MPQLISDCAPQQIAGARNGSAKLLASMQAHHDFNVALPAEVVVAPSPPQVAVATVDPEPKKIWFSVIGEMDVTRDEPRIDDIRRAACRHFNITKVNFNSERRTKNVVYPRHVAMYLARQLTTRSLPEIGRQFGGRDHTTVLHGARKIEAGILADWKIAYDVAHVEAML